MSIKGNNSQHIKTSYPSLLAGEELANSTEPDAQDMTPSAQADLGAQVVHKAQDAQDGLEAKGAKVSEAQGSQTVRAQCAGDGEAQVQQVSEQQMLQDDELLGKAMQGMLKDAFAQAVVDAAFGNKGANNAAVHDLTQSVQNKLQALLTGQLGAAAEGAAAVCAAKGLAPDSSGGAGSLADNSDFAKAGIAPAKGATSQSANLSLDNGSGADAGDACEAATGAEVGAGDARAAVGVGAGEGADDRAGDGAESGEFSSEDLEKLKEHLPNLELYPHEDLKAVREYIEQTFGPIYLQVEDSQKDHIRCDIDIIKPNSADPHACQYLVTKGMGAHKMPVPEEFSDLELQRAELYLALPADWPIEDDSDDYTWPISLLNVIARLPFVYDSWMAQGHIITFPDDENYAPQTKYAGAILLKHQPTKYQAPSASATCQSSEFSNVGDTTTDSVVTTKSHPDNSLAVNSLVANGQAAGGHDASDRAVDEAKRVGAGELRLSSCREKINFYQVVLLYAEEIAYAEQYSARTLMKLMENSAYVCSRDRQLTKLRKPKAKPSNSTKSH